MGSETTDKMRNLLRERHLRDIFVPECKNGATWGGSHRRLDAWAMRPSWTAPVFWGYEIKASRSDFLQDKKWREYLPLCSRFYFVMPRGIVEPSEIPSPAGLLVPSKNWKRLEKAKHAEQIHPGNRIYQLEEFSAMLLYIIMARAIIVSGKEKWRYERGSIVMVDRYEPDIEELKQIIRNHIHKQRAFKKEGG